MKDEKGKENTNLKSERPDVWKDDRKSGNRRTRKPRRGKGSTNDKGSSGIPRNNDHRNASNSVDDFALDQQLLKDVASIPFSWAVGTPLNLHNKLLETTSSAGNFTIPGICVLEVDPTVGHSTQASDPINVAANRIYALVRHANSGSKNYDAPDLMLYLVAISNVFGYIMQLQRILGTIGLYSVYNRYIPDELITAMGGDPSTIRNNIANFRGRLNMLITKAASFAVPSNMPYFKNMVESLGNYYIEGTSMKDQIYLIHCDSWYKYDLNADGSGMLKLTAPASTKADDLLSFGETLLDRLIYSEDMNIMSGDILKAYGSEGIYKLTTIPDNYAIMPLMDIPVLEQIKNATTVGMLQDGSGVFVIDNNVVQDPTHAFLVCPTIITSYTVGSNATADNARALAYQTLDEDRIMTTTTQDVSPALVMENSKYMVAADSYKHEPGSATATLTIYPRNFIPKYFKIVHGEVDSKKNVKMRWHSYTYATPVNVTDVDELKDWIHQNAILQHFKFSPILHQLGYKPGTTPPAVQFAESEIYQDVDNYAIITDSTLKAMHEAALLSLFHVVSIAQK